MARPQSGSEHRRSLSRRRFLAGAAGLAAYGALSACNSGSSSQPTPARFATERTATPRSTATPAATGAPATASAPVRGGALRYTGFVESDASFDPHKTQAAPFYGIQSAVFSRLIAYDDLAAGTMVPDLAERLPEQPDDNTYIFSLRNDSRWQDRPPLGGRPLTGDDVRYSIERQRDGDGSFPRKPHWQSVESIEVPNDRSVIVTTSEPLAAMPHYFADVNAYIVAPELTAEGDIGPGGQVGSGPFTWIEWNEAAFASLGRNSNWRDGSLPYLDGVSIRQLGDTAEVEALLRTTQLDLAFLGLNQAERLQQSIPELETATVGESRFWGMRFLQRDAPFNDVRFRSAVSAGLDRRGMLASFFGGGGEMNPWISWPISRWTLPAAELQASRGYRPGAAGREQDIREARALLDAYTGDGNEIPDDLELAVLETAEDVLSMGTIIREQLRENLDLEVNVVSADLSTLVEGLLVGRFDWVAGPDTGWIDLDDWVYPYFHSQGTKNTFGLRNTEMDGLIEAQRQELDEASRREIGFDIQRLLLQLNLGVNFVSERIAAIGWPYVRDFPLDVADGYQFRLANTWIDTSHPRYPR